MSYRCHWESRRKNRKDTEQTTITAMDYSKKHGIVAIGGVEGLIALVDPSAKVVTGSTKAHAADIIELFFYDEHVQILSVASDRVVMLWDAHKLECLQ